MSQRSYSQIDDAVLAGMEPPPRAFFAALGLLAVFIVWMFICWMVQIKTGIGVSGLKIPAGWAVYITNFVFWVGIAHSGTLISAILHLVRSRWRTSVSRSAEAMTIFAVMTAGLFPLIHLGRDWVFYFILPYPSQRGLWPNFLSPLVWDVVAVSTYFTVSLIFFYVGLIPDLAVARDRHHALHGPDHPRTRLYRRLALGWTGSDRQWRHYGRAYLFFAALATPLVISVHSVVSWDFAMSLLPGWHSTIFPPYFVAGAIHSGLAMVLTLMIPMRRLLHLEALITLDHLEAVGKTIIVTGLIVAYAYGIEPFIAWYSGDQFERQFSIWRATGGIAWIYYPLFFLNIIAPMAFLLRRARRSLRTLFVVSLLINLGMWLERLEIIVGSTAHDFMPHNWASYLPTWVEWSITIGAFAWFLFFFFSFSRTMPTVAIADVKEEVAVEQLEGIPVSSPPGRSEPVQQRRTGVMAVYDNPGALLSALEKVRRSAFSRVETFSPFRLDQVNDLMHRRSSPVRYWTLAGALCGFCGGFALAIGAAKVNSLIVGAKYPVSIIPYFIVAFEGTVLLGTIFNFVGLLVHCRLGRAEPPAVYDRRFSRDRLGLFVDCSSEEIAAARELIAATSPEEIHVHAG